MNFLNFTHILKITDMTQTFLHQILPLFVTVSLLIIIVKWWHKSTKKILLSEDGPRASNKKTTKTFSPQSAQNPNRLKLRQSHNNRPYTFGHSFRIQTVSSAPYHGAPTRSLDQPYWYKTIYHAN
jgi:hypothetical protein